MGAVVSFMDLTKLSQMFVMRHTIEDIIYYMYCVATLFAQVCLRHVGYTHMQTIRNTHTNTHTNDTHIICTPLFKHKNVSTTDPRIG